MMPRSDENMKELAKDLDGLVLEHKALIARYEERLDGAGSLETDDLVRSQIEFLVLNVRAALVGKEQELRQVNAEIEYRRQADADRESFRPPPGFAPPGRDTQLGAQEIARLIKWPPAPEGAIDRVIFRHRENPTAWMPAFRFPDTSLAMAVEGFDRNSRWEPGETWQCEYSEPIEGAANAD